MSQTPDLDQLRLACKKAVDERKWVEAIRGEEPLATPDHSMRAMERSDEAHFNEDDTQRRAQEAREAYKDGLRNINYGM